MLCFRVILWGVVLILAAIPGIFLVTIIGRVAGFRPGSKPGDAEKVFGWLGVVLLGGLMLGICAVGGLVDWAVSAVVGRVQRMAAENTPQPKFIPPHWDEKAMATTYLSDMEEFNVNVGFGAFGKKGKLGYAVSYGDSVRVAEKHWPNALSAHPPLHGSSTVSYRLGRNAKLFKTWTALSDLDHALHHIHSAAVFRVLGDGTLLWKSPPNPGHGVIHECRISVEGIDVLELRVDCPGGNENVRAVWLEPHVLR